MTSRPRSSSRNHSSRYIATRRTTPSWTKPAPRCTIRHAPRRRGANAQVSEDGTRVTGRRPLAPKLEHARGETAERSLISVVTQGYLLILQGIASITCLFLPFLLEPKWSQAR